MNGPAAKSGKVLIKIKILKKAVVLVFSDEEIKISHHTFSDFLLYENKVISYELLKDIKKREQLDTFLSSALNSLARSNFSERQIRDKLSKKGANSQQINAVVKILKESHLLDDQTLMKEYVSNFLLKGYGQRRIISLLKEKGFQEEMIREIFFDEDEEYERAANLFVQIEKKYDKFNYLNKKQKIYLTYLRLGYKPSLINEIIQDNLVFNHENEINALESDYKKLKQQKKTINNRQLIEILLKKGYRYEDIFAMINKGE